MKSLLNAVYSYRIVFAGLLVATVLSGCATRDTGNYSFGTRWAGRLDRLIGRYKAAQPKPADLPPPAPYIPPVATTTTTTTETVTTTTRTSGEIRTDNVLVTKTIEARGSTGADLRTDITLTALRNIGEVQLNLYVPENATFVRSEPPPTRVSGKKVTWEWFQMKSGEVKKIAVWLRPTGRGNVISCLSVHALPFTCVEAEIGEPRLAITKTGPATAAIGQPVTYTIRINNTGNTATENVVVTDFVPAGMSHSSGARELKMEAGSLQPGETKTTTITLTPQQRGEFVNRAEARSSNAGAVSDTATTRVVQSGVKIDKTGPPQQFLGKSATYQITVSNTGDTPLSGVVVTDNAPPATTISDASGGQVSGNQATWSVGSLGVGQSRTFSLSLRANQAGNTVNTASVSAAEGVSDSAQASTLWRGFAAVLVEMVDDPDPLLVGESVTYTIRVTNQGTAPDSNVRVNVRFPSNIQPVSSSGITSGDVSGNTVTFGVLDTLAAKQVATWTIRATASSQGDGRITAEVNTEILKGRPVAEVESTQVY